MILKLGLSNLKGVDVSFDIQERICSYGSEE